MHKTPGPGAYTPKLDLTNRNAHIAATFSPGPSWRTAPLPRWKQEVNNVGFPLLDSTLSTRAAQIKGKPTDAPTPRHHNPPMNRYDVPRWPHVPFRRVSQGDADVAPSRFTHDAAQKALATSLYERDGQWEWDDDDIYAFRKEHEGQPADRGDGRQFSNPGPAAYHPDDALTRNFASKSRAFAESDHWRTAPIPLWKQEVNNVPFAGAGETFDGSKAVKIVHKPVYPPSPRADFPAPTQYNVPRFPNATPAEEMEGKLRYLRASAARRARVRARNHDGSAALRNHALPASKAKRVDRTHADAALLRPVKLPDGIKRAYSMELRRWYWYDPVTSELCLAPQDETPWLAQRRAALHHDGKSLLYAEEGVRFVDGVTRRKSLGASLKTGLHDSRRRGEAKRTAHAASSPFLSLATHKRTKSGMRIPKQSVTSLPLSSIRSHQRDIMSWTRYRQGAHAVAVGPCFAVAQGDRRDGAAIAVVS